MESIPARLLSVFLHATQVIFLVAMVFGHSACGKVVFAPRGVRGKWFLRRGIFLSCIFLSGAGSGGLLAFFADKLEQVMVVHGFDFIRKQDKAAVDVIEFAAVELVSELFITPSQSMAAGVLA